MKNNKEIIIGFIIGILIFGTLGVTAATLINSKEVTYDNTNTGFTSTNLQDATDELYQKIADKNNVIKFKLGDYVSMTPTKTSFTVPMTLTGYTSDQTINPSELNLWRVIKINDNGTVEMVSEYVSSTKIFYRGQIGFTNYVGTLNYIAKQYENSKYTSGSRHIGYNGQTEYITDTSKMTYPAPWNYVTENSLNDALGGGDTLCDNDVELLKSALGTVFATDFNGIQQNYCLASRNYWYNTSTDFRFQIKVIATAEYEAEYQRFMGGATLYGYMSSFITNQINYSVRPVVILKSNIKAEGLGTAESPYILD